MGNVDDLRKAIQDLVSPDLKALTVRMDALEKEIRMRFDQAEKVELERFAAADKLAATRHETALNIAAANHASLILSLEMEKRLTRLESDRAKPAEAA